MRKNAFLWSSIVLFVLLLVLAFENIWLVQQYFILFYTFNASSTIVILLSGFLGFLVGFFFMLYSYESRRVKEMEEESDTYGTAPVVTAEKEEETKTAAPAPAPEMPAEDDLPPEPEDDKDSFDEDDEVLG